jgi:predicted metal-dependent hydrolase
LPSLTIGNTLIPFEIRHNPISYRRRIILTPYKVEVVVPVGDKEDAILTYLHNHRRWIYEKREEMMEKMSNSSGVHPERFVTGAKILYRGRRMRLNVQSHQNKSIRVEYQNGFLVQRPENCSDFEIQTAFEEWLKDRVRKDVDVFVKRYSKKMSLVPKQVRVKPLKHLWGSCGKSGIIHLNWQLIFAPKSVLEYAVVHELCHLQYRNHSPEFWTKVKEMLPDYEHRKNWLDRNEHSLETSQLGIERGII